MTSFSGKTFAKISLGDNALLKTVFFKEAMVPPRESEPKKTPKTLLHFAGVWTPLACTFRGAIFELLFSFRTTFSAAYMYMCLGVASLSTFTPV